MGKKHNVQGKQKEIKRIGAQEPTAALVLPYKETRGDEAIGLYNETGRTCQPWQENILRNVLAVGDDGLWIHTKFGWSVPRRNGKTEVAVARVIWGLLNGEKILYTAHRTTTSHAVWEHIDELMNAAGFQTKTFKQFGLEKIESADGSFTGKCNFRTRSSKGGLGEGYDLLLLDECQEYTDDQASALKYLVTSSQNPQTLMFGTPPTAVSAGTVFLKYRDSCLFGSTKNSGWAEWAVDEMTDCSDVEAWYKTNPSLGTIFTERSVNDEIGSDPIDFNIQRLGLWLKYNQKSVISENDWKALQVAAVPAIFGRLHVGIKFSHNNSTVAMSIAVKTEDGRVFVESIDDRPITEGFQWITDFLAAADVGAVIIDGANGQTALAGEMKDRKLIKPVLPRVADIIAAGVDFEMGISQHKICHTGQESLMKSATNVQKRAIGSNGGFGYRSLLEDIDVSLLESAVLAYWSALHAKEKKKQKVLY